MILARTLIFHDYSGQVENQPAPIPHGPEQQVKLLEAAPLRAEPVQAEPSSQARDVESEEEIDGPPEIIWEGNQITVRKRRVKKSAVEAAAQGEPKALDEGSVESCCLHPLCAPT